MALLKREVRYPDQELNPSSVPLLSSGKSCALPSPFLTVTQSPPLVKVYKQGIRLRREGLISELLNYEMSKETYKRIVGKHFPLWSFLHLYQESSRLRTLTSTQGSKVLGGEGQLREGFCLITELGNSNLDTPGREVAWRERHQGTSRMDSRPFPSITQAHEPLYEDFLEFPRHP